MNKKLLTLTLLAALPLVACGGDKQTPGGGGSGGDSTVSIKATDLFGDLADRSTIDGLSKTVNGITFSFAKGSGSSAPAYYTAGTTSEGVSYSATARTYLNNKMTVSATQSFKKMEFTFALNASDHSKDGNFSVSTGSYSQSGDKKEGTWTGDGDISNVVFTVSEAQRRIESVTVTFGKGQGGGGGGGGETTYTVEEVADKMETLYASFEPYSEIDEEEVL